MWEALRDAAEDSFPSRPKLSNVSNGEAQADEAKRATVQQDIENSRGLFEPLGRLPEHHLLTIRAALSSKLFGIAKCGDIAKFQSWMKC